MPEKIKKPKKKTVVRKKIVDANEQMSQSYLRSRKKKQIKAAEDRAYKRKQGNRSK